MSDTTPANEQQGEELELTAVFSFHPEYGDIEDDQGRVNATAIVKTVAFGIGDPKLLLEIGVDENGEKLQLTFTAGDLNMMDLKDLLVMSLASVKETLKNAE